MLEGVDKDDMYIIVEDEFLAIAKAFTQHLHHAEYVRLKNSAKSMNASAIQNISRPTDSRVAISEETKRKKAAQASTMARDTIVEELNAKRGKRKPIDAESEVEDDPEEDLWVGTSLQGFMADSKKPRRSLSHLAGMKSGSKAAAGFRRAGLKHAPNSREPGQRSELGSHGAVHNGNLETEDEDDDDLDAPIIRPVLQVKQPLTNIAVKASHPPGMRTNLGSTATARKWEDSFSRTDIVPLKAEKTSFLSRRPDPHILEEDQLGSVKNETGSMLMPFDYIPEASVLPGIASQRIQKRLVDMKARAQPENEKKQKRSNLLDEIPTFLV